jgi:hypothetical protein
VLTTPPSSASVDREAAFLTAPISGTGDSSAAAAGDRDYVMGNAASGVGLTASAVGCEASGSNHLMNSGSNCVARPASKCMSGGPRMRGSTAEAKKGFGDELEPQVSLN